jgi:hypothetical protein
MSPEERLRADFDTYLRGKEPAEADLAGAPLLKNWEFCITREPSGERCMTLMADVIGPPDIQDKRIETSALVWIDRRFRWARSRSRLYRLESRSGEQ